MAVKHKSDSIQLIRDTEGIDNKDRVRILSPGSSPPKETTEVTEHALYMELENTPGDGEPYEYEFACASGRRFIPQRAGDANKLEGKTSAEVKALFADGRAVFAGSGTSVTLDAKGDRVHSIIVNGFTKQTGSGTPSLENRMPITTGGMRLVEQTLDGSSDEAWKESSTDEEIQFVAFSDVFGVSYDTKKVCYTSYLDLITSGSNGGNWDLSTPGFKYFARKNDTILKINIGAKNVEEARQKLNKRPITIWREVADESQATGLYIPVIGTGGEYSAKCVKITDHLCAGDRFITKVKIECDKKIVVDGENVKVVDGGPTYFNIGIANNGGIAGSRVYKSYGGGVYNSGSNLQLNRADFGVYGDTPEDFNNYCKNNPLILWYCSAKYTKENFSEVALEQHLQGQRVLNGVDESWTKASDAGAYYSDFKGKPSGKIISEYLPYATATETKGGKTGIGIGGLGGIQLRLPNGENPTEYFPENPLLIVYELTSTIVYAHEPVDFEFSPGEDGAFTITGDADGTLDVYYKALQDGGDADKLGGKLPEYYAAAANALGQYTHTKSGTVHELTGTGDNIRFVATADFAAGDTVKVNGTTCTVSTMSGDALWAGFFKSGAVVVCYRTRNALNFSGGGLAAAEAAKITPENLKTGVSVTVNGKTVAGTFTADGTAAAGDMLLGKTGYVKGQKVTGTIPSKAAASYKPGTSAQTIKAVQYLSGDQTIEGDAALIAANIKYGASIFDVDGSFTSDANAVAAEILTGKIGYVKGQKITGSMPNQGAMWEKLSINGTVTIPAGYHNGQGKVTQSIPTKGAASYKPGTSAQTILSGQYLTGNQTIQGDGNLVAGNIRSGVSIFGVAGTYTGTVNAACVIMSHQNYDFGDAAQYTINQSANIVSHVSTNKGVVTFKFNLTGRVYVTSTFFKSADNDAVGACSINGWVNVTTGQTFTITTTIGANGHGNNKRVIAAVSIAY